MAATTFYVHSTSGNNTTGDGSLAKPWKNIVNALASASLASGDIVQLMDAGPYTEVGIVIPDTIKLYGAGHYLNDNTKTVLTTTGISPSANNVTFSKLNFVANDALGGIIIPTSDLAYSATDCVFDGANTEDAILTKGSPTLTRCIIQNATNASDMTSELASFNMFSCFIKCPVGASGFYISGSGPYVFDHSVFSGSTNFIAFVSGTTGTKLKIRNSIIYNYGEDCIKVEDELAKDIEVYNCWIASIYPGSNPAKPTFDSLGWTNENIFSGSLEVESSSPVSSSDFAPRPNMNCTLNFAGSYLGSGSLYDLNGIAFKNPRPVGCHQPLPQYQSELNATNRPGVDQSFIDNTNYNSTQQRTRGTSQVPFSLGPKTPLTIRRRNSTYKVSR